LIALREYQDDAIKAVMDAIERGISRQLILLPTGCGKTIVFSALSKKLNKRTLVIAHREELIEQAKEKFELVWPETDLGIVMADQNNPDCQVVIASIQTAIRPRRLEALKQQDFELLVIDECFAAGTMVGNKPIETLCVGEQIPCFDESTKEIVQSKIVRIFKNPAPNYLIEITIGGETIICTGNHPFFTNKGWKVAQEIKEGDLVYADLSEMWKTDDPGSQKMPSLLSSRNGRQESVRSAGADAQEQSNDELSQSTKNVSYIEGNETSSENPRWQRTGINHTSSQANEADCWGSDGICNCDAHAESERGLSRSLQNRHCNCQSEISNRDRRLFSRPSVPTTTGSEKGRVLALIRVDSTTIHQRGNSPRYMSLCPDGYVYNVEVERYHTYFANGVAVHNCHHAAADTYQQLIRELGFMESDPTKLLVGVTATAKRGDKLALNKVFQEIVYEASVGLMIRAGYLTDLKGLQISTEVDLSEINLVGGDFNLGQLADAVNTTSRNQVIVDSYLEHSPGKCAVAFCVDVQHALDLAAMFSQAGIKAAAVYGDMPKEERRQLLKDFKTGKIQVLANCQILTEGFDCPEIQCLLMARPTKSQSLFIQMVGRGTRLYPGKEFCLVIDFCDSRHDVCQLGTLLGKKMKDGQSIIEAIEEQEREEKIQIEAKVSEVKTREFDLLNRSRFRWMALTNGCYRLPLGKDGYIWLRQTDLDKYKILLVSGEQVLQLHEKLLPLGYSQGVAEDFARKSKSGKLADKQAQWRNLPMSEAQAGEFIRLKADIPTGFTRGEASDAIEELKAKKAAWKFEPATPEQKARLTKMGVKYNPDITKGQAGMLIYKGKAV